MDDKKFKFDVVIGNPPYQDDRKGTSKTALPIYNNFMDEAFKISDKVELITPARFLFNAGRTPKKWNKKMLSDKHLKVLFYEKDPRKVFSNTEIKGGVAVTYWDRQQDFGAIGVFTEYPIANDILHKIQKSSKEYMSEICGVATKFNTENLFADFSEYEGHERRMSSNVLSFKCFYDESKPDSIRIYGIVNNSRNYKNIDSKYVDLNDDVINKYKIVLPKADGNGGFGDILTNPEILGPKTGFTHTFFSVGSYETKLEAENGLKYIKTKFLRLMLSFLKVTQDNSPAKWKYVPLQDFTESSDIDWSKSIPEIDQQLYKKYGLNEDEINFIETKVKEMS